MPPDIGSEGHPPFDNDGPLPADTGITTLAGVPFPHMDQEEAVRHLYSPEGLQAAIPWRFMNTYSLSIARVDASYAALVTRPGMNLADGKPVAWVLGLLARRHGAAGRPAHVRGPGFFVRALDESRARGVRHFFLGGSPETLQALVEAVRSRFPGIAVAGAESPPFRPLTDDEKNLQDQRIRASGADVVWVGLGTPRQDVEAARLASSTGKPALAVGAAFDFVSGQRREAPAWVRRSGLEWLHRLIDEPQRLWRRYTIGIYHFAVLAARELLRTRRSDTQ